MTTITVTDHALVRYLERALGLDFSTARWAIEHAVREAADAGASSVRIGGLTYMLKGHVVVTVIDGPARNMAVGEQGQEARV